MERILVCDRQLPKTILSKLNEQRRNGTWCDLRLEVASYEENDTPVIFPVHGCIVASASETFALIVEKNIKHAILSEIDSYNFSLCLDFIYGSKIFVPPDDIVGLIDCAEKLHLSGLVKICENSLKTTKQKTTSVVKRTANVQQGLTEEDAPTETHIPMDNSVVGSRSSTRLRIKKRFKTTQSRRRLCSDYESDAADMDGSNSDALYEACTDNLASNIGAVDSPIVDKQHSLISRRKRRKKTTPVKLKVEFCKFQAGSPDHTSAESSFIENPEGDVSMLPDIKAENVSDIENENTGENGETMLDARVTAMEDSMYSDCAEEDPTPLYEQHLDLDGSQMSSADNGSENDKKPARSEQTEQEDVGTAKKPTRRKTKKKRSKSNIPMSQWLQKYNKTLTDFCFDDIAEKLNIPEHIRPLLEWHEWPDYYRLGRYRGTPRMAYRNYYMSCFMETSCEICDVSFRGMRDLRKHTQKEHGERHFCSYCGKTFSSAGSLKMHEIRHNVGEKNRKCELCDFVCYFKNEMNQHVRRRHREMITDGRTFLCSKCASTFQDESYLRKHEQRVHNKEEWKSAPKHKCDVCNYVGYTQKDVKRHAANKHSNLKPFVCQICRRAAFKQRTQMYTHIRKVHGQEPEKAKVKTVGTMLESEPHQPQLLELLPPEPKQVIQYQCTFCEYSTIVQRNLKCHLITHADNRPFKCSYCPEDFKRRDVLVRHTRRHHKVDIRNLPRYHYEQMSENEKRVRKDGDTVPFIAAEEICVGDVYVTQVDAPDSEYFPFHAPT